MRAGPPRKVAPGTGAPGARGGSPLRAVAPRPPSPAKRGHDCRWRWDMMFNGGGFAKQAGHDYRWRWFCKNTINPPCDANREGEKKEGERERERDLACVGLSFERNLHLLPVKPARCKLLLALPPPRAATSASAPAAMRPPRDAMQETTNSACPGSASCVCLCVCLCLSVSVCVCLCLSMRVFVRVKLQWGYRYGARWGARCWVACRSRAVRASMSSVHCAIVVATRSRDCRCG
jgi:hypothetical protein